MRICALLSAFLCASSAHVSHAEPGADESGYSFAKGRRKPDDFVPHETDGPALSIGVGELYVGYGASLAYHFIPQREGALSIAPHFTVGRSFPPSGFDGEFGARVGVLFAYGGERRVLADVAFGALGSHGLTLHGVPAASRIVEGISLAVGVERMDVLGLFLRALIGGHWLSSRGLESDERLGLLFALGVGWKPW